MVEQIRAYLIDSGITDTIYIGYLPASPDRCIVLYPFAGFPPDAKYQYNRPSLKVVCRDTRYEDAFALAHAVYSSLQSLATTTISGGLFVVDIQAYHDPYLQRYDEQMRVETTQLFTTHIERQLHNRQ
jgi:hypothetical protein